MPSNNPEDRRVIAQIAAHEMWAKATTPAERAARTAKARAARDARFLEAANGDPVAADHLRRAHYARMSLKAVQARRAKAAAEATLAYAEAELRTQGGDAA